MRRLPPLLLTLAFVAGCAVAPAPVVPWPQPPPAPVTPPPPTPGPVEPAPPPAEAPQTVQAALGRLAVGMDRVAADGAVGLPSASVPGNAVVPPSMRWVLDGWMIVATLGVDGRVAGKQAVRLGENP